MLHTRLFHMRPARVRSVFALFGFATAIALALLLTGPTPAYAQTTITVDSAGDPEPDSNRHTCTYEEGLNASLFGPADDGECTLRRALREASARPDADRPITIEFNLPSEEAVDGVWTVTIEDELLELFRKNLSITGGQVILDGNSQPGGRDPSEGPKVFIELHDSSFEIRVPDNEIRNLGFFASGSTGGGVIFLYEGDNLIENIWMGLSVDGTEVVFRTPGQPHRMAGGGIFIDSDNNIVRDNVITGAFAKAVDINSGNTGNRIESNLIGTRADGTVPTPFECSGGTFDEVYWFGGWGISLAGTANEVLGNRIAGLDTVRLGANDTPPIAIEVFGNNHTIQDNVIGIDSADNKVGVCGQAIKVSDSGTEVLRNVIYGSKLGFEGDTPTAMGASGSTSGVTVRFNRVEEGPGRIYDFLGNQVPSALRQFRSGRITSIDGVNVTGSNGQHIFSGELITSTCPNCLIDFYLDDNDDIDEALDYLGETTADAGGNFTFTLDAPLEPGMGLRTISTAQNPNVIGNLGSGTTARNSILYLPLETISITLPMTATAGMPVSVTVTVGPENVTTPLDFLVEATDLNPGAVNDSESQAITGNLTWNEPGEKTVDVTVDNEFSSVTATTTITVEPAEDPNPEINRLHIPIAQRD